LASNVEDEGEDVWRGKRARGGVVIVEGVVDARWMVAARLRMVWRRECECMMG
jgi:hypothetical protein